LNTYIYCFLIKTQPEGLVSFSKKKYNNKEHLLYQDLNNIGCNIRDIIKNNLIYLNRILVILDICYLPRFVLILRNLVLVFVCINI
jgi:hypothetical protein